MITTLQLRNGQCESPDLDQILTLPSSAFDPANTIWIDMCSPTQEEEQKVLVKWLGVNEYVLEDVRIHDNEGDRLSWRLHTPKAEEYPDFLFLIYRSISITKQQPEDATSQKFRRFRSHQVNIFLNKGVIITHHVGDIAPVDALHRKVSANSALLKRGPDFVAALLADSIVDELEDINEILLQRFEVVEHEILDEIATTSVIKLQRSKRLLQQYRTSTTRMADVLSRMARGNLHMVDKTEVLFFSDVYEHVQHVLEQIDMLLQESTSLIELHFSMVNAKLNVVMRRLTALSTIFLPITFITSWYGMNFQHMPELNWANAYPLLIGFTVIIIGILLFIFRKRGWLA